MCVVSLCSSKSLLIVVFSKQSSCIMGCVCCTYCSVYNVICNDDVIFSFRLVNESKMFSGSKNQLGVVSESVVYMYVCLLHMKMLYCHIVTYNVYIYRV